MIQIAFWNGFWVFIGVVAGAGIQYRLMQRTVAKQREMAFKVLRTEAEMNCAEVDNFLSQITYLKDRVGAGQIEIENLFVSMQAFDYSALNPLVNSGHFHSMLSAGDVRSYLEFARFFSNGNAQVVNSQLRTEHDRGKSIDYLDSLARKAMLLKQSMEAVGQRPSIGLTA
ncbi:hypothetical protein [Roseobacter sp. A03A-229]